MHVNAYPYLYMYIFPAVKLCGVSGGDSEKQHYTPRYLVVLYGSKDCVRTAVLHGHVREWALVRCMCKCTYYKGG